MLKLWQIFKKRCSYFVQHVPRIFIFHVTGSNMKSVVWAKILYIFVFWHLIIDLNPKCDSCLLNTYYQLWQLTKKERRLMFLFVSENKYFSTIGGYWMMHKETQVIILFYFPLFFPCGVTEPLWIQKLKRRILFRCVSSRNRSWEDPKWRRRKRKWIISIRADSWTADRSKIS